MERPELDNHFADGGNWRFGFGNCFKGYQSQNGSGGVNDIHQYSYPETADQLDHSSFDGIHWQHCAAFGTVALSVVNG